MSWDSRHPYVIYPRGSTQVFRESGEMSYISAQSRKGLRFAKYQTFQPPSHANLKVLEKTPEKPGD